jgi:hypothetical protein
MSEERKISHAKAQRIPLETWQRFAPLRESSFLERKRSLAFQPQIKPCYYAIKVVHLIGKGPFSDTM